MVYNVVRTDSFENDYDRILGYLCHVLNSPSAASRLMDEVGHAAEAVEHTPFVRTISSKPHLAERELREYFILGYVIVYQVIGDQVVFVRMFHQSQLYDSERYWRS